MGAIEKRYEDLVWQSHKGEWKIYYWGFTYRQWSYLYMKLAYKHTTWIPRWNDVETTVSTSFQRRIHVVCL